MSGALRLPGEPGKYVTILDLKEQWMKQQEEKKRAEKEREEREACEKVSERFNELNLKVGSEVERSEAKRVGVGVDRRKSGGRERSANRGWNESSGSKHEATVDEFRDEDVEVRNEERIKTRIVPRGGERRTSRVGDGRRGGRREWTGGRDDYSLRVSRLEKVEVGDGDALLESKAGAFDFKKKELQLDDVEINGDDQVAKANHNPKFTSGCGLVIKTMHNGRRWGARVSDFTENGNVVDGKNGRTRIEEVGSKGDEHVTKTNCPCHSRSENQHTGGYWVCKFVGTDTEVGESSKGKDVEEGNLVDTARKKYRRKQRQKKRELPMKVREEISMDQERKETMPMIEDSSRMINQEYVPWKKWPPRKKCQSQTVKPSVEIEEHSNASAATERQIIRSGKFGARGSPVDGRMYHSSYNSKMVQQDDLPRGNEKVDVEHEIEIEIEESIDFGSVGFDKPKSTDVTEGETNSKTILNSQGNGTDGRKSHGNFRFKTERNFGYEKKGDPKYFNGRMREERQGNRGLMWVKKGEASVNSVGSEY